MRLSIFKRFFSKSNILNSKKDFKPNKNDDYGYFFYPERFGNVYKPKWYENLFKLTGSSEEATKALCEKNVENAIKNRNFYLLLLSIQKIES